MYSRQRNFINWEDDLVEIKKIISESYVTDIDTLKAKYKANVVLKKEGLYYFCETIPDTEILEEIIFSDEKNDLEIRSG
jgi:hypothetical protein